MTQSLNYDSLVESELKTGNRYAEHGHLIAALKMLSDARESGLETYPVDSTVGQAHELRVRRDIAAVDARLVFNGIIPDRFLNDRARAELDATSDSLKTASLGLAALAFTPEGTGLIEEHLHSEAGMAEIWRGRIQIAMGVLSLTEQPRRTSFARAAEFLGVAKKHVMAGNNLYYVTELFGQLTRLQTLTGNSRTSALRSAEEAAVATLTRDRANFGKAVRRVLRYGLELTPEKVEGAIREGKI